MNINELRAAKVFSLDERDERRARAEALAVGRLYQRGWTLMERLDLGPTMLIILTSPEPEANHD